jgi:putative tricarboxylic transport membrane protein
LSIELGSPAESVLTRVRRGIALFWIQNILEEMQMPRGLSTIPFAPNIRKTAAPRGTCWRRFAAALFAFSVGAASGAEGWQPQKHVEIVVGSAPGGINDRTARVIEKIISEKKLLDTTLTVVNRPGGGGNIASSYVHQRAGDPHYLLVATTALGAAHIVGSSRIGHVDFTPIALLLDDYLVFVVNASGDIKSGRDLAERIHKAPKSVTTGFANSIGNHNHIAAGMLLKAMGGNARDLKVVVFKGSAEAIAALLGNHIDVIPTAAGNAAPHIQSGKMRGLGVTSEKRLYGSLASIPTWKEQGIDLVSAGWRAIFAPGGLSMAQIAYWEGIFRKVTEAPEWKAYLEKNYSSDEFRTGTGLRSYLDRDYAAAKAVLSELGLTK